MMKHKWHKEIKAWADGAEIEFLSEDGWLNAGEPEWNEDSEYRIKPQPKQPKYLYAYFKDRVYLLKNKDASNRYYIGKIELHK